MMAATASDESAIYYLYEPHHLDGVHQPNPLISPHSVSFPILPSNAFITDALYHPSTTSSPEDSVSYGGIELDHTTVKVQKRLDRLSLSRFERRFLEHKFNNNKKPTKAEKETIAEQLGLKFDKVNAWFNNHRQLDKKRREKLGLDLSKKLEKVERKRAMTMASSPTVVPISTKDATMTSPKALDKYSPSQDSAAESCPIPNPKPAYASPLEACYASLQRVKAMAEAARPFYPAESEESTESDEDRDTQHQPHSTHDCRPPNFSLNPFDPNFYPVSAFSDWGSSSSSMPSYTPTPAGQVEDPFEYDTAEIRGSPAYTEFQDVSANCSAGIPVSMIPVCYQDEFAQFVMMAESNAAQMSVNMPLRAPPPSRRPSKTSEPVTVQEDEDVKMDDNNNDNSRRPSLTRSMTCPNMLLEWGQSEANIMEESESDDDEESTITSEKIKRIPTRLPRSNSFNGNIPILSTDSNVKKNKGPSLRNRVQKFREAKISIPKSPLRLEQLSDGHYFDHTTSSSVQCESDASSIISMGAEPCFSGRYTPPTPISPSEQYSISKAEPRIAEIARDMETVGPKPQRLTDCRKIFELTVPMVDGECLDVEPHFGQEDISFFGLNMLESAFEFHSGKNASKYPEYIELGYHASLDVPPAPPMAYGGHGVTY